MSATSKNPLRWVFCFFKLYSKAPSTTRCRVKRHWISTSIHKHGSNAEVEPAPAFYTHHPNTTEAKATQGHKLYSKVLTIEPNRLLSKCSELNKEAKYRLCLLIVPLLDD
jgi:hypothetical protein